MPLHRRVPKRGFTNIFKQQWATVSVEALDRLFGAGAAVDLAALRAVGAVQGKAERSLKVLGNGELTKALTVTAHRFTEGAKKKIEAAGGRCEVTEVASA